MVISSSVLDEIYDHAMTVYSDECCGFLLGNGEERTIKLAFRAGNIKSGDRSRRFKISASDYLRAEQQAIDSNLELLGVYHSHPDHPAVPSEHDLKNAFPNFSYIIISVKKGKVDDAKSWRLNNKMKFEKEKMIVK